MTDNRYQTQSKQGINAIFLIPKAPNQHLRGSHFPLTPSSYEPVEQNTHRDRKSF